MDKEINLPDTILIASSYIFAFPSLYLILSERRKERTVAFHAGQALLLWMSIMTVLVVMRVLVNNVLANINIPLLDKLTGFLSFILWLYAVYCAIMFLMKKEVKVPLITPLADRLA